MNGGSLQKAYFNGELNNTTGYYGAIIGYQDYTETVKEVYGEGYYLIGYIYRGTLYKGYLMGTSTNGYSSISYGEAEITKVNDVTTFDFATALNLNSSVWDTSGTYPVLVNVDHTPVYTETPE